MCTQLRAVPKIGSAENWSRLRSFSLVILAVVGISLSALAQQATIVGTITDPSGAAMPNVDVTVINIESNAVKKIQTNADGQYVIPDLNIGHYTVKAERRLQGRRAEEESVLQVGDRARSTSRCKSAARRKQ